MKVIEKFNYDRDILEREFMKFSHREGAYHCDAWASDMRNSMETLLYNGSAKAFMDWAWSEYPEYRTFQVVDRHFVILDPYEDGNQNIVVVDLFSTGWQYHCDLLKKKGLDISRLYEGYERKANMYDRLGYGVRCLTVDETIKYIDGSLRELKVLPPRGEYQFTITPDEEDRPFYDTYIAAMQYLKKLNMEFRDQWEDLELLNRMGLGKWVDLYNKRPEGRQRNV